MGWVAVFGGAFIAGCFVYKAYFKAEVTTKQQPQSVFHILEHGQEGQPDENIPTVDFDAENAEQKRNLSEITAKVTLEPSNTSSQHSGRDLSPVRNMAPPPPQSAAPSIRSTSPPRLKPPTFSYMRAPPRPTTGAPLRPPPSAASSLRVPTTKVLPNASMAPSSLMAPPKKPSRQVVLKPGHSPLDWAMLTSKPNHHLRGSDVPDNLIRVSPSQLKYHTGRKGKDAWTVYQGKVYNITPYLAFHPGGESELMKSAGREAGKLFLEVHPWVNWEGILGECLVGILVGEGEEREIAGRASGGLDEMD